MALTRCSVALVPPQEMAAQLAANRERAEQIMADRARVEAAGEQLVAHRKAAAEDIRSRMQEDAKV